MNKVENSQVSPAIAKPMLPAVFSRLVRQKISSQLKLKIK